MTGRFDIERLRVMSLAAISDPERDQNGVKPHEHSEAIEQETLVTPSRANIIKRFGRKMANIVIPVSVTVGVVYAGIENSEHYPDAELPTIPGIVALSGFAGVAVYKTMRGGGQ